MQGKVPGSSRVEVSRVEVSSVEVRHQVLSYVSSYVTCSRYTCPLPACLTRAPPPPDEGVTRQWCGRAAHAHSVTIAFIRMLKTARD